MEQRRKKIGEILGMPHGELLEYLRESDVSLHATDSLQIVPFEHGIKVLYFHKDSPKPFKTKVFLKNAEGSGVLE
ncbi:MAG TPA: hypothetical protein VJ792_00175 [Candidatus Nitrosotalea sp.]|nr:hypothetical protein [Candidatus Nitrosotalea sp.]